MSNDIPSIPESPIPVQTPQAPPIQQQQPVFTVQQVLVKMIIDAQNNLNTLIALQQQQIIYINTLMKNVSNESGIPNTQENSNQSTTNQPSNSQPVS